MDDSQKETTLSFVEGAELIRVLVRDVSARQGDDENLRLVISDTGLRGRIADLIVGARRSEPDLYSVTVDRSRTLAEMVAAGRYDQTDGDINEKNFPSPVPPPAEPECPNRGPYRTSDISAGGRTELELVHLARDATTEEVEAELVRRGLHPADLWELLDFGERYPDVQRKFPVIALGSSWADPGGYLRVPCLGGSSGYRYLYLDWDHPDGGWRGSDRFLAVRK